MEGFSAVSIVTDAPPWSPGRKGCGNWQDRQAYLFGSRRPCPPALARFSPITLSTVMKRWLPVLQSSSAVECGKGGKLAAQRFNLRRPVETE